MTPVQFFDPVLKSWTIFAWGENSQLHKWAISSTGKLTYIAQSNEFASADVRGNPPGGMPGGFCSGSSNESDPNSAILVCTIPYGDANAQVVNGRLLVYDAVHLAADGSLKVLWDSQRFANTFLFNKFDPPVIDGGQIYVPNYNGGVDLYRLVQWERSMRIVTSDDPEEIFRNVPRLNGFSRSVIASPKLTNNRISALSLPQN
jgi:hypothetical protein